MFHHKLTAHHFWKNRNTNEIIKPRLNSPHLLLPLTNHSGNTGNNNINFAQRAPQIPQVTGESQLYNFPETITK